MAFFPNFKLSHFPRSNQQSNGLLPFHHMLKNMISDWLGALLFSQNTWEYSKKRFPIKPEFRQFHTVGMLYLMCIQLQTLCTVYLFIKSMSVSASFVRIGRSRERKADTE